MNEEERLIILLGIDANDWVRVKYEVIDLDNDNSLDDVALIMNEPIIDLKEDSDLVIVFENVK